jgi:uncharacterized protein (DUF1778 family)
MGYKMPKKISIRVSKEDKRVIKRAAKLTGRSMAAFIRESAEEDAKRIIYGHKLLTAPFEFG